MNLRENPAAAELAAGDAHHAAGQLDDAAAAYRRAVALNDRLAEAWWGLGCIDLKRNAYAASARCFATAAALCPDWAEVRHNLGKSLFELGEIEAALAAFIEAARVADSTVRDAALAAIATIIPGCSAADNAAVLHARRARAASRSPAERSPSPISWAPTRADRLRIGYVSSFFDRRNWMKPVIGLLNHHDRARFELHLFCDGPSPGADTGFQPQDRDHIHDVRSAPNDGLAAYIRRADIDILVDLNGYSAEPRLGLYVHHPAPFVLGWFGLYATSGMAEFDFIVGDATVIPAAEERFYSERVLRVPGSYLAFSVNYPTPELVPPPCRTNGRLTFGCLASPRSTKSAGR
ncbi:MAG: tetratricopeptide repeat protein [Alphaproteobacteria bacterium]|nr:tetratricopeptide repeat protein [Alphaproteobacteria bacterium]